MKRKNFTLSLFFLLLLLFLFSHIGEEFSFQNNTFLWIGIILIQILLSSMRDTQDTKTQILKYFLLFFEIYFFLLLLLKPFLILSWTEFFFLYSAVFWLAKESFVSRKEKWKKWLISFILGSCIFFFLANAILIPYRKTFDEEAFINQEHYQLFPFFSHLQDLRYSEIYLKTDWKPLKIPSKKLTSSLLLEKNTEYEIHFMSQNRNTNNFLLLQSPERQYLQIFPQSKLSFFTQNTWFLIKKEEGNILIYTEKTLPSFLKENYQEFLNKKTEAQKKLLPQWIFSSPFFQKLSLRYTFFLWKLFPSWYAQYAHNAQTFLPLFSNDHQKKNLNFSWSTNKILEKNFKNARSLSENKNLYLEYFKKFF